MRFSWSKTIAGSLNILKICIHQCLLRLLFIAKRELVALLGALLGLLLDNSITLVLITVMSIAAHICKQGSPACKYC